MQRVIPFVILATFETTERSTRCIVPRTVSQLDDAFNTCRLRIQLMVSSDGGGFWFVSGENNFRQLRELGLILTSFWGGRRERLGIAPHLKEPLEHYPSILAREPRFDHW